MRAYTTLERLENGNLRIALTEDGRQEAQDVLAVGIGESGYKGELAYWIEDSLGDGWELVAPEELGSLTCSPILSNETRRDEHTNELLACGRVYWFPDYMVRHEVEELLRDGSVVFIGVD